DGAGVVDVVIKAAAVADYAPSEAAPSKIKKEASGDALTLTLQRTPDILAEIGAHVSKPFIVAFAAETEAVEANAREKLLRKNADLIVATDVAAGAIGF